MYTNMELMQQQVVSSSEHIIELVLNEEELSWQKIIHDLVKTAQMDPWDIDLAKITQRFLEVIRQLQRHDFRISGKVVLASALLLKIKSDRLLSDDMEALDTLIDAAEESEELTWDDFDLAEMVGEPEPEKPPRIYPRTPQPRQRKVSVYDLVTALEQALDVSLRRQQRALDAVDVENVHIPESKIDVTAAMNELLGRIDEHYETSETLVFSQIRPETKKETVLTFIPLLHLTNERRIDLEQKQAFADFSIHLLDNSPVVTKPQEEVILA